MTAGSNPTTLPRSFFVIGVPLAGIVLVAFFVYLGFPYDKLGDRIASEVQRNSGIRVDFQDIGASLSLTGPGIEATGVRATLDDGQVYRIERAMLRPAWSLTWFRGVPAIYTEIASELGGAAGTLLVGEYGGWDGEFTQVAVGSLPIPALAEMGRLDGLLDATIDLVLTEDGPEGHVEFSLGQGSVGLAHFPMDIPFETLSGELIFGGENLLEVVQLDLEGPMLDASLTGKVLQGPSFAEAPIRLEATLTSEPNMRPAITSAGIRVDRGGKSKIRFTGTVGAPIVR